ncbi:peptidase E [Brevibacterium renqingii]|uniref:Type 1 glutamine amidotransferase-like domain-containing protein n=1 Tax=Brevibacterium renqingii TaxID=2776916 RepID=UPI001ADED0FA|nr:peptidase E [Brevibacterium renqingii]
MDPSRALRNETGCPDIRNEKRVDGTIVALGGGGFSMSEDGKSVIDERLLDMAEEARANRRKRAPRPDVGTESPNAVSDLRVCFVPTASGDDPAYIQRFEDAFAERVETHVLSLFGQAGQEYSDPSMLLDMDLVYVGGGSSVNLLALWRRHGVDDALRQAAANEVILAGISAGANCWFDASSTDSFGQLAPLNDGLGFISGSACPHFHGEADRAETFHDWIGSGELPGPGLAIDDGAAVVFDRAGAASVMVEEPEAWAFVVSDQVPVRPVTRCADRVWGRAEP